VIRLREVKFTQLVRLLLEFILVYQFVRLVSAIPFGPVTSILGVIMKHLIFSVLGLIEDIIFLIRFGFFVEGRRNVLDVSEGNKVYLLTFALWYLLMANDVLTITTPIVKAFAL
jgi:hypothetical protein